MRRLQAMVADQSNPSDPSDLSHHCRNRNRNRDRSPFPNWHPALMDRSTSLPSYVRTATIRLRYPAFRVRIPSRVLSIPRPIATPTPILLRHEPFWTNRARLIQELKAADALASIVTAQVMSLSPWRSWRLGG